MKYHKTGWIAALSSGIIFLMSANALADKKNYPAASSEASRCQTSLERFCLHLEACSKQRTQAYYKNLHRQIRDFLNTSRNFPAGPSQLGSLQLERCENLLKVIQDIVGKYDGPVDLAPMPGYSSPQGGKLTGRALETTVPRRPLRIRSIQYTDEGLALNRTMEADEGAEEANEFKITPSSAPRFSRTRKSHTEETKELE